MLALRDERGRKVTPLEALQRELEKVGGPSLLVLALYRAPNCSCCSLFSAGLGAGAGLAVKSLSRDLHARADAVCYVSAEQGACKFALGFRVLRITAGLGNGAGCCHVVC